MTDYVSPSFAITEVVGALPTSYSTAFPATQNPLSESGKWRNGLQHGLLWNNVQTTANKAFGAFVVGGASQYNDPIACLDPAQYAIPNDQYAQGTVFRQAGYAPSSGHEIELLLRFQITANNARGYEILWSKDGQIYVVRWNGPINSYSDIGAMGAVGGTTPTSVASTDGKVLKVTIVGNIIRVYINAVEVALMPNLTSGYGPGTLNGLNITTIPGGGSVWTSGNTGIGFYPVSPSVLANYGWKDFSTAATSAGASVVPTWFSTQSDNTWQAIAVSGTVGAVVPNPSPQATTFNSGGASTIFTAWSGGMVDEVRRLYYLPANGGHADYAGNETYMLDLKSETPAWKRITAPTPTAEIEVAGHPLSTDPMYVRPDGICIYSDGFPRAMHATFGSYCDDRVWYGYQNSFTSAGGAVGQGILSFNTQDTALLSSIGYNSAGQSVGALTPLPRNLTTKAPWGFHGITGYVDGAGSMSFGVSAPDPVRHRVWCFGGKSYSNQNPFYWYISTSGATIGQATRGTLYSGAGASGTQYVNAHAACYCPGLDVIAVVGQDGLGNTGAIMILNCATGTLTKIPAAQMSGVAFPSAAEYIGMVYIPASKSLALWHQTDPTHLYKVGGTWASTGTYNASGTFVRSSVTTGGVTIPMVLDGNGNPDHAKVPCSKFAIVPDMGDGRAAIVQVTALNGPTYVYKIPAAGI